MSSSPPSSAKNLLTMLEVANMEGGLPDVKSQLDPKPFGVGSPTEIWLVAKSGGFKDEPWLQKTHKMKYT